MPLKSTTSPLPRREHSTAPARGRGRSRNQPTSTAGSFLPRKQGPHRQVRLGLRQSLNFWVSRNRRLTVALLLCLATGITVQQLTPASEQRVSILVAAHDLAAGTSLTVADFTTVGVPPDLAISGALEDHVSLVGRQLASPLTKGQIPTESNLLGPGLLTGAPVGSAAVPLRMADPSSIQLLSPGQLVNVVLTAAGSYDESRQTEVLAASVPVLWTSAQGGKPGQWLGTSDTDGLMVVAADPRQAEKLAGASTQGKLFFVLVNP
ncbi:Flp pilus assembly protein CpaB [Paenarthrobacter sp. 2TAF44]|uniref:Flp pilus assembly protein CpaB n=1 Tax=Paenarthrobacter sp. 2TAF44 TaxID=3233018 RepID=UPI003F981C1F